MLDKWLCEQLNIDEFTQYVMAELDKLEDEIHLGNLSATRYIEVKAKYDQMREVRDAYADFLAAKACLANEKEESGTLDEVVKAAKQKLCS